MRGLQDFESCHAQQPMSTRAMACSQRRGAARQSGPFHVQSTVRPFRLKPRTSALPSIESSSCSRKHTGDERLLCCGGRGKRPHCPLAGISSETWMTSSSRSEDTLEL